MKGKRKNSNYKISFDKEKQNKKSKGSRFVIIFVCVFLALVITVGAVVGIVAGIRDRNTVVKYKGVRLTQEEVNFIASYCKYDLLSKLSKNGVKVEDTAEFWNTKCIYAENYGELLKYNTKQMMKQIVAANYVFDTYASLSDEDKRAIKNVAEREVLEKFDGDEEKLNEAALKCGFSKSDLSEIFTKIYKYEMAYNAFFSANSASIKADEKAAKDFYLQYSRVKLIFIREQYDYKLDENGEHELDDEGNAKLVEISEEEKAKRKADITKLTNAVLDYQNDGELPITPQLFEEYLEKYPSGYQNKDENGFYLHENASNTKELATFYPDVITEALYMEQGFSYAETNLGVCFIYKMPVDDTIAPYLDTSEDSCFLDFFSNLVANEFGDVMVELAEGVELGEGFTGMDFITHPVLHFNFDPEFS